MTRPADAVTASGNPGGSRRSSMPAESVRLAGSGAAVDQLADTASETMPMPAADKAPTELGTLRAASASRGSASDFGEFVSGALPGLLRYGYALAGDPHDGADLVQDVLMRMGSRWPVLCQRGIEPRAYALRAMANAHISRWRRLRREHLVAQPPDRTAAIPRDRLEDEPLWQALRELPTRQRTVLVLRYYADLSEAEIAETLGVRPGTVKSQAAKALAKLRERLGGKD